MKTQKRILYLLVIGFFLMQQLFVFAAITGFREKFETVSAWYPFGAEDTQVNLSAEKGFEGNCLRINFDLGSKNLFVVAITNVSFSLPDEYKFRFYIKGIASPNNLEFKLIDDKGDTFWKKWENFEFPNEWKEVVVDKDDIIFAWGEDESAKPKNITKIEIAISGGMGGKGQILIDELELISPVEESESLKTSEQSKSILIDNFENIASTWKVIPEEAALELINKRGYSGNAMYMKFDLKKSVFVVASKELTLSLPLDYKFEFFITGQAQNNNLEFKLIDERGNTFWKKLENITFPPNWEKITISQDDITFGWGPEPRTKPGEIKKIEFAISAGSGGSGEVGIDELTLCPLEVPIEKSAFAQKILTVTASSFEDETLKPENVVDGNRQTRWSSQFSDPQWLQIALDEITDIIGVTLHWESAYGEAYDILVSPDGINWKTVYSTNQGDGKTDIIYFPRTPAKFVKIYGKRRGTNWGYSLYEIKIKGIESEPFLTASATDKDFAPEMAMDGNSETMWKISDSNKQWIEIDLRQPQEIGGLFILWGDEYANEYEVYISSDEKNWEKIFYTDRGNGNLDKIYIPKAKMQFAKINVLKSATAKGFAIREIEFKGDDEMLDLQKQLEALPEAAPSGYYPYWLSKEQAYWTIVGAPEDKKESLICEDGSIEFFREGPSIMPYIYVDDKFITRNESKVSQSLEKDYLPIPSVVWEYNNLRLTIQTFAWGKPEESASYVSYKIENVGKEKNEGNLFLALRPFQVSPPWQMWGKGGVAKVNKISFDENNSTVSINEQQKIVLLNSPDKFGAREFKDMDIIGDISKDNIPSQNEIDDKKGLGSAAIQYNFSLSPGSSKEIYLFVPFYEKYTPLNAQNPQKSYKDLLAKVVSYWDEIVNRVQIEIPEKDVINTWKANIAYILINSDGPALQPGSRTYERSWMRDGALIASALLKSGITNEVKEFINWFTEYIFPSGKVPCVVDKNGADPFNEYDSQGEYIFTLAEYYRFTKDKEILSQNLSSVEKVLGFMEELRSQRTTSEFKDGGDEKRVFYGIFPESASHEGYCDKPMHSYWDDFWGLKGWKDARFIALVLGDEELAEKCESGYNEFKQSIYDSIRLAMKLKNINYIPGCAEKGDFDATSTGISIIVAGEEKNLPQAELKNTFDRYYTDLLKRFDPDWTGGFTPYEARTVQAFIYLNQKERALKLLRYLLSCRRPLGWNHLAEVVHFPYRKPLYIGDMPHTWVGSDYINAVRSLFLYEKDDKLILAAGVDEEWLDDSDGISVQNAPTYFGSIRYSITKNNDQIKVIIEGTAKPPAGFTFISPYSLPITSVSLNGEKWDDYKESEINFVQLPVTLKIEYGG